MVQMEKINGADIVYMSDNSLFGVVERNREHGFHSVLKFSAPSVLGVVCEYNGAKLVVKFGSKVEVVPLCKCRNKIRAVYRNNGYLNKFASLDLQDSAMAIYANYEQYKIFKRNTEGNVGAVMLYVLTSSRMRYPTGYAKFDFKINDLLDESNGFNRIL